MSKTRLKNFIKYIKKVQREIIKIDFLKLKLLIKPTKIPLLIILNLIKTLIIIIIILINYIFFSF